MDSLCPGDFGSPSTTSNSWGISWVFSLAVVIPRLEKLAEASSTFYG